MNKTDLKRFDTPEQFMSWLESQSEQLRVEIAFAINVLMEQGVMAFDACHICYVVAETAKQSPATTSANQIVH